jgi:hypothetical protein
MKAESYGADMVLRERIEVTDAEEAIIGSCLPAQRAR